MMQEQTLVERLLRIQTEGLHSLKQEWFRDAYNFLKGTEGHWWCQHGDITAGLAEVRSPTLGCLGSPGVALPAGQLVSLMCCCCRCSSTMTNSRWCSRYGVKWPRSCRCAPTVSTHTTAQRYGLCRLDAMDFVIASTEP